MVVSFIVIGFFINLSYAGDYITPEETGSHIGEVQTVCGEVVSTKYATRSNRQPTFLNLNKPYPDQIFTALIWDADRDKFKSPPEIFYNRIRIRVTDMIEEYKGKPEILVNDPSQITVKE